MEQCSFVNENSTESQIERAMVLRALGRKDEAVQIVTKVVKSSEDALTLVNAGLLLEGLENLQMADSAFTKAATTLPLGNYYRARLKIRKREYDSGLDLLERAMAVAERQVRILLGQDKEAWAACAGIERFQDLLTPGKAGVHPGR